MKLIISKIRFIQLAISLGIIALFGQSVQAGEFAVAVTESSSEEPAQMLLVDTDAPEVPLVRLPLIGLLAGENVKAIDLRPANGEVWALTSINRILLLDLATGALDQLGNPISPTLLSTLQPGGFEFNPTVDRVRLVSAADENMRLNPLTVEVVDSDNNSGNGTTPDTSLTYMVGDPNAAADPHVVALAHDRNDNDGATATTLFGIDSDLDILIIQGGENAVPSPNLGQLTTLGSLGVNVTDRVSFDITMGSDPIANNGSGVA